EEYREDFSI
nr:Chain C, C-Terminal peptide of ribosomal S4 Domain protein [Ligilactobacillus salivarius UCC118]